MAGDVVIRLEGLGKKYIIGHETERERYGTLRDVVTRVARNVLKRTVDAARGRAIVRGEATEEFWALKDVSFEVKRARCLHHRTKRSRQVDAPEDPLAYHRADRGTRQHRWPGRESP